MTKAPAVDLAPASRWFAALFGDFEGAIEIRALPGARRVFFRRGAGAEARRFVTRHGGLNLYAGVALRRWADAEHGSARKGTLEQCIALPALFIDLDFKMTPADQAREAVRRFLLRPSIVVRSGGGVHLYWLLREPMDLREEAGRAKELLRRLARHLGGDLSSAEPARVLRIPGTFNFKYAPARPVTLERLEDGARYNPGDFDSLLPGEPVDTGPGNRRFSVPEKISAGRRNSTLYRLGRSLKARGLGEPEIVAALIAANRVRCEPPLEEGEVRGIAHQAAIQQDRPHPSSARVDVL